MSDFLTDIRYGWRQLVASASSAIIAVGTLAVVIGLTTAVYSLIYTVVLRPMHIADIDRVVNIYGETRSGQLSWPAYQTLKASYTVFSDVTGWTRVRAPLTGSGVPEVLSGEAVEGNYFELLGVTARLGRVLDRGDDAAVSPPVVVLSDGVWRTRYHSDPQILGQTIKLNGQAFEVIGVMPAAFRGVDMPNLHATAFWVTFAHRLLLVANVDGLVLHDQENRWISAKARLGPDRTIEEARTEISTIGERILQDGRGDVGSSRRRGRSRTWRVAAASSVRMHESIDAVGVPVSYGLMGALALVLLIACLNIGNLMLARSIGRGSEIATRLALGASRGRIIRQFLTETGVLCALGGGIGLVLAFILTRFMTVSITLPGLQFSVEPRIVWPVLGTAAIALFLAGLVFGLAPTVTAARTDVRGAISDGGAPPRRRTLSRRVLVVFQLAVSLALLSVGSAIFRGFVRYAAHDPGFDLSRTAMITFELEYRWQDANDARPFLRQLRERVRTQPGVSAAAVMNTLPIGGPYVRATFVSGELTARTERSHAAKTIISGPEALEVLGIPLIRGRFFGPADTAASPPVAVINQTLAEEVFGTQDVIGRRARLRPQGSAAGPTLDAVIATIVGVVRDADVDNLRDRDRGLIFVPLTQRIDRVMSVAVRAPEDPDRASAVLAALARQLDPDVVSSVTTGDQVLSREILSARIGAAIAGGLGGLAFLLAVVGLYGVMSHLVSARTREIGIRMALGAETHRVVRMFLREGIVLVLGGSLVAAVLAYWMARLLRRLVVGLESQALLVALLVDFALGLVAMIACWVPARRAARIDPNVTLRAL